MRKVKATILGLSLIVLGVAVGFKSMTSDNPNKTNPNASKNFERGAIQQDGPGINLNNYDTDGTPYYTDNFDGANDTTSLKGRGYFVWYRGTGPQGTSATWFQGNDAVFAAFNGPTTGYVGANFNAVTSINNIDNWLITPANNVAAGDSIVFYSRTPSGSIWPDSVRVMYSSVGSTTPEGTWTELGRFKVNTTGSWERRAFGAPGAGASARFAIRYNVVNGGPSGDNSNYIGIDALTIEGAAVANDMGSSAVVAPIGSLLLPTQTVAPKATFTNVGSANQTNVPVRFSISGPVNYTSNKTISSINASTSTTVTFDSTFVPTPGTYNVTVIVSLGSDQNRNNDTLRSSFTALNPNYGTSGGFSYANSVLGNGAPSQPEFCWKDTAGSVSLVVNSVNSNAGIFTGSLDDGYWAIGNALKGKKVKLGGVEYDSFFVSTNGIIGFARQSGLTSFSPSVTSTNRPAFYPLWSDMNLSVNANYPVNRVSYKLVNPYQLLVSYDRIPEFSPVGTDDYVSYQAVIDLVDAGFPGSSKFLVQFADTTLGRTGAGYRNFFNTDGLNAHVIGVQSASGAINSYYRAAYPANPPGTMFSTSPVAIQFGSDANKLNAACGSATLNLGASIEAVTPNSSSDTITVLLRASTAPYEIVDAAKVVLSASGNATVNFTKAGLGRNYYIVVKYRSAIETWSANAVNFAAVTNYNFKTSVNQAYGSNMVVVGGNASFYSGDVNQDGTIDGADGSDVDNDAFAFISGYVSTDVNNDDIVDGADATYVDNNAFNFIGIIRP